MKGVGQLSWTYQQVIDEADERYPNSLSTISKLRKVHIKERELFRTIYRVKTAVVYDILAGQPTYPLDFHVSKIIRVVWNGETTDYEEINNDQVEPPFIYTYENSIGRYPTPEEDVEEGLFIYHWYEPWEPDESKLSSSIQFDPDFPMVLVYDLCKQMAEINREFDIANGFITQHNSQLDDFIKANPEPELPPMRVE